MNTTALLVSANDAGAANAAARPIYFVRENADLETLGAPEDLIRVLKANGFRGEAGALLASETAVALGVGDGEDRLIAAGASDRLPPGDYRFAAAMDEGAASLAAFAWLLGAYRFSRYRTAPPSEARLIAPASADIEWAHRAAVANGFVRDLVNTPAGDMGPEALEAVARSLAKRTGADVSVTVGDRLLADNFPLIHAVGRAAAEAPRLIDLRWARTGRPKVTLIGKGVCFDTGGLNLKPGEGMALMKKDMGGAAHALGLAQMLVEANADISLRVLIPAVENAVSGGAFRPGDIIRSRAGLTVEIGNTDAEGRLVLADALTLAGEDRPDLAISLATLTGAARVAVGPDLAPFYCDDEALAAAIADAAAREADPVWRLPLWKPYSQWLSSTVADMNNITGGSFAGSITAALFLKRFAPENASWAHFDIYAWRPKSAPGRPVGAEAQAVRTLFRTITERFA